MNNRQGWAALEKWQSWSEMREALAIYRVQYSFSQMGMELG